mgnify:CR=1 FL=1
MKKLLFVLLMLIAARVSGQSDSTYVYQSFFGNDSTRINIYDTHIIDALHTFVINISSRDTVNINGTSYYKTTGGDYDYSDLYYREDRETGRLYQYVERNDIYVGELKVEVLICDMSLNVGDTFHFPYELDYYTEYTYDWEPIIGTVTDVRYEDGKKIIEFDEETSWSFDIFSNSLTFTEGEFPIVVPTRGLFGYNELLCQFKDGEQTYHNPYYEECHYDEIISVEEIESKSISIFPTIFSNNELISINTNSEIKEVKMIDMLGREINISINLTEDFTSQISLNQRCNSGIYLIIVETEKEVYYEKVILRD